MFWFWEGICFLPTFLVIWSSSTFIVSYLIALFEHDVDVIFPYISDTGAEPPESCVFGLMTVITAFAGTATMYARYKFVEKLNEKAGGVPPALNQAAFWIGMLSCLGMCFVATFQSIISYKAFPYGCSLALCRMRTGIATIAFLAVFPTVVCAVFVTQTTLHRKTEDEDYVFHLVSAVSEWIVAFSFIFFFFTYIHDFKKFTLKLRTQFVDYS
uniref:DNA damage-regulated autophagy modulator protein 1-like isoform X2 n=1 Tax=Oncorhynchus gorbuscha TaxID=8017 RepID=UPI001EAF050C|nr:DNA damage-regulated autophagy modulator protein 1-like isoform X2 [Oncorhynchus gorbuscha]